MQTAKEVQEAFERDGIRHVKVGGFDIEATLRGKYVSIEKFSSIVENGMGFCDVIFGWDIHDRLYDRPGMTGWHTGYPDTNARIDLTTYRRMPWEPGTACFLLDFENPDGQPLPASPRQLLKKVIDRAKSMGFVPKMAVEYEFFIYQESAWSIQEKGFRGLKTLDPGMFGYSWLRTSQSATLVHDVLDMLRDFRCPLEGFHTETGPGIYEAALAYTDALEMADRAALFKTAMKEICTRHGALASFMAKPSASLPGCSGHIHQSLWSADEKQNIFHDDARADHLSQTFRHYIAGQVALMPELCALIAPNVNSYKRLLGGEWAPSHATWGTDNRTCALRTITGQNKKATRIEYRLAASDINPYIAMAASLAAGLYGIENQLEPPAPVTGNAYEADESLRLPTSLAGAVERLAKSSTARSLLGDAFVDHYLLTRAFEVRQAEKAVTDWELARYLETA
ncbi:MAG: glutamine synthetase [Deltaproteobacteria bacterium]|nr:glutamine synthetase [Deltaproteobacteria bacterium]